MGDEIAVAVEATQAAGILLLGHFRAGVDAEWKGDRDPVTVADHVAERLIRDHLTAAFPDDVVVGEEGEHLDEWEVNGQRRWYVDPLDGTSNFLKGSRRWAVSVAFCDEADRMVAGVVHLPCWDETYTAEAGAGAWLDGTRLAVTGTDRLGEALVAGGQIGWDVDLDRDRFLALVGRVLGVRVTGSTVSDLADVAAGRSDAFWASSSGRWDLAAGALLAAEAGATVTDLAGVPITGPADQILVAGPGLHDALLRLVGTS